MKITFNALSVNINIQILITFCDPNKSKDHIFKEMKKISEYS